MFVTGEVSIANCKNFILMVYCFLFFQRFLGVFASFIFQSTNRTSWIQEQSRVSLWVSLVLKWVTSVKFHKKVENTLLPWMSHSLRIYLSIHWREMKYWSLINRSSHPHLFKIFHLLVQLLVNNQFLVRANIQLKKYRQRPWKFTREKPGLRYYTTTHSWFIIIWHPLYGDSIDYSNLMIPWI